MRLRCKKSLAEEGSITAETDSTTADTSCTADLAESLAAAWAKSASDETEKGKKVVGGSTTPEDGDGSTTPEAWEYEPLGISRFIILFLFIIYYIFPSFSILRIFSSPSHKLSLSHKLSHSH